MAPWKKHSSARNCKRGSDQLVRRWCAYDKTHFILCEVFAFTQSISTRPKGSHERRGIDDGDSADPGDEVMLEADWAEA